MIPTKIKIGENLWLPQQQKVAVQPLIMAEP